MRRTTIAWVAAIAGALAIAPAAIAQTTPEEDLFAVIALQGKPCGKVVKADKRGENDYDVTCQTGDRYRVYVKDGRVIIETR